MVLILPYWNVNILNHINSNCYKLGFNLTLLECKYITDFLLNENNDVLILPYWNVNLKH